VGLCAYIPFDLWCWGKRIPCAWFVDFFVLSQYQGKGLGRRLTTIVQERFQLTASLSQSDIAFRVFRKAGWTDRSYARLCVHPFPRVLSCLARISDVYVRCLPADRASEVASDLDSLWETVRDRFGLLSVRDSVSIAKRFVSTPQREYTLLLAYRKQKLVGYMVVRMANPSSASKRPRVGLMVDYLADPKDGVAFRTLLGEASWLLVRLGAKRCYCLATHPCFQKVLARLGFLSAATPVLGRRLKSFDLGLTYFDSAESNGIDPRSWFLTMADCDIDSAWYQD